MYKISIIVPVFNVEDTLQDAFDSILNQSIGFENLEVIFVDDKSTDRSADIIKEFSERYSNVKSMCLDENSGFAGKPRNTGIENASADYLMFLERSEVGEILCRTKPTEKPEGGRPEINRYDLFGLF